MLLSFAIKRCWKQSFLLTLFVGGGKVAINNFGCDGCPMLKFHNLCLRLETLDVVESWRLIENWVSNVIDESDRKNALARISDSDLASPQQRNEARIYFVRLIFLATYTVTLSLDDLLYIYIVQMMQQIYIYISAAHPNN